MNVEATGAKIAADGVSDFDGEAGGIEVHANRSVDINIETRRDNVLLGSR